MAVLVYVDNLVLTGNDSDLCAAFKKYLNQCFHIKDLDAFKYFSDIKVARNSQGFFFYVNGNMLFILSMSMDF